MLLRRGGPWGAGFVSPCVPRLVRRRYCRRGVTCLDLYGGRLGDVIQLASIRDRVLVAPQEHGPPAPGSGGLAPDCRRAHLGAWVADSLHRSDSDGANALAATRVGTAVDRVRPEAQGVA